MKETRHTIEVKKVTRERLKGYGRKGESYDQLINRILDQIDPSVEAYKETLGK